MSRRDKELRKQREARARRIQLQYSTPVEAHMAERMKRKDDLPDLPCLDPSQLESEPEFDRTRFERAVRFYHQSDIQLMVRHQLGIEQTIAKPTSDGGIRISEPSPVQDLAIALRIFRARYHAELFTERTPVLVDMGSYDGRVVTLAGLLGFCAYGIEIDPESHKAGLQMSAALRRVIADIEEPRILLGDYTNPESFKRLGIEAQGVDVFFNYDDSNPDKVAEVMTSHGKRGSLLLLHSYMENRHRLPLDLETTINSAGTPVSTYDVFRRR